MVDSLDKRRRELPERDRPGPSMPASVDGGGADVMRSLQQGAGNAAVTSLLAGGIQRAPARGPDQLMDPSADATPSKPVASDAEISAIVGGGSGAAAPTARTAATPEPASASGTAATPDAAGGMEAQLYEETILGPMRALYACVHTTPPDYNLAAEHLQKIGFALWDYEKRFRGRDDGLANAFYAARGWLGRPSDAIHERLGNKHDMTADDISASIEGAFEDLNGLSDRFK